MSHNNRLTCFRKEVLGYLKSPYALSLVFSIVLKTIALQDCLHLPTLPSGVYADIKRQSAGNDTSRSSIPIFRGPLVSSSYAFDSS